MSSIMVKQWPNGNREKKTLAPAEVIRIHEGGYTHWAMVSDRWHAGKPMLIALSKRYRRVTEEDWSDVVGAKRWDRKGHLGNLDAHEVLWRARSWLGREGVYRLLGWNCQNFAHWAHGVKPSSPEVAETLGWATVGAVVGMMGESGNWKRAARMALFFAGATMLVRGYGQTNPSSAGGVVSDRDPDGGRSE